MTSPSSRERSTRSRNGCPRSWKQCSRCPSARSCSTARRWRSAPMADHGRSSRPPSRAARSRRRRRAPPRGPVDTVSSTSLRVNDTELDRRPGDGAACVGRWGRPGRPVGATAGDEGRRRSAGVLRRRRRPRSRGRGGEVAGAPYEAGRRGGAWLKVKPVPRWTWWCSPPSGATAAARAGCRTSTSAPAIRTRPAS